MIAAILWFLASAVVIDLVGYWLHRWIHVPGSWGYRSHMTHHVVNYPPRRFFSDRYRSSRADSLVWYFAPFGLAYALLVICLGLPHPVAVLVGAGVSVSLSSILHDLTHIQGSVVWRSRWFAGIAARHHLHHFKMGRNFGILFPWWDVLFRTRREAGRTSRRQSHRHDL
jgi:sterol desaturase/sphingolipid hydroxylase (fatty acid hydroxylase superfamily)